MIATSAFFTTSWWKNGIRSYLMHRHASPDAFATVLQQQLADLVRHFIQLPASLAGVAGTIPSTAGSAPPRALLRAAPDLLHRLQDGGRDHLVGYTEY